MALRDLPSIEKVLSSKTIKQLLERYEHQWIADLVRASIEEARSAIKVGEDAPSLGDIVTRVEKITVTYEQIHPRPLINATGVIIHTNLGRAPLSREAIEAMTAVSGGYSSLEIDLQGGKRGSRQEHIQRIICQLTGAQTSLVVNNNASAVLLGLSAIARGRDVIVSKGEAVEIGGGFRIPDVLTQSGAALKEVGTANRTYLSDYEAAITKDTACLLKIHPSNFRLLGFTHSPELSDLVDLGRQYDIPVLHDIGSGCLLDTRDFGLAYEVRPQDSIQSGVGLTFFSGDKLLGGPQSGIVVGTKDLVSVLSRHPLARAVRIDKTNLAGLTATLLHYLKGDVLDRIPIWKMVSTSSFDIKEKAIRWQVLLGDRAEVLPTTSTIGGGSLPGETLDSWAVVISPAGFEGGADEIVRLLREQTMPVISRIENDKVVLDPRTVLPEQEEQLITSLREILR